MDEDRTLPFSSLFPLSIRVEKGHVVKQPTNYPSRFVLGRSDGNDLQFSDSFVGRTHAEIWFEQGRWWVKDLGSVNKTYLNGELLEEARPLPSSGTVELGKEGVVLTVSVGQLIEHESPTPFTKGFLDELSDSPSTLSGDSSEAPPAAASDERPEAFDHRRPVPLFSASTKEEHRGAIADFLGFSKKPRSSSSPSTEPHTSDDVPGPPVLDDVKDPLSNDSPQDRVPSPATPSSLTGFIHDFIRDEELSMEEKGQKIRDAVRGKLKHHARWYHWIIVGISCVAFVTGLWALYNYWQIQKFREEATVMFATIKAQQMEVLRIEAYLSNMASPKVLKDILARREAIQLMYRDYDAYLEKIGVYQAHLSEQDQVILRMARLFGESELDMPPDFSKKVKEYIAKWQSTPRLREAIRRAVSHQYPQKVSEIMLQYGLPPQFFYLALQESDFDVRKVGPSRPPYGIAKGPWQFMPATAMDYKLRLGPLVKHPKYDPLDERHDFQKSTVAAAKHIRHLYTTEAQASILLLFASYNWGQGNMRKIITQMPENPRERNFWRLLKNFNVPQETYNYVLYIFSAVVIGENPRLWGFEFDNPLTGAS